MKLREILIAVVVLAVVIAVVVTMQMKRAAEAKRIASTRNLQQWGIALNLYLIDNENQLPEVGSTPITPEQKKAWYNALPPYISQAPLADLSPSRRPRPGVPSLWVDAATKPVKVWDDSVFYFNYAMNKFLQPVEGMRSFRIYEINYPANVVFLTEVEDYSPAVTPGEVVFRNGKGGANSPEALAHVLFCDGHVQLVTRAALVDDPKALTAAAAENGVSWFQQ